MIWCYMICTIWCDMIWYDMIWYDRIWYDTIWYDMIWHDMIWYDMIWYDMIWYDMIWSDMIWYDMICYDMMWLPRDLPNDEWHSQSCSNAINIQTSSFRMMFVDSWAAQLTLLSTLCRHILSHWRVGFSIIYNFFLKTHSLNNLNGIEQSAVSWREW